MPVSGICMISDRTAAALRARSRSSVAVSFALSRRTPNRLGSNTIANARIKSRLRFNIHCLLKLFSISQVAPSRVDISPSRSFRTDSSILEGATFCEMLRGKRETHRLTRLTNNPKTIPSLTPQFQRPVQCLLRVAQFLRRKARGSRSLCKPYRRECLPHFRMDLAFGFLDIRQAGAFKVVYTFDDLILDRLGLRLRLVHQHCKSAGCGHEVVGFGCYQQRKCLSTGPRMEAASIPF